MDIVHSLLAGLQTAIQPINLLYCLVGTTVGNLIGILPGIGPVTAMALLLPFTFGQNPTSAMIMLAGIYYGAMYGGAATSVLLNIPGEPSAVPTAIEGYPMAREGRAGAALGMAAIASFFAGTVGVIIMTFLSPMLAELAVKFGPPEYFSLMIFGVCLVTTLSGKSILRGWISATIGLIAGTMGQDVLTGVKRFTFGRPELAQGIDFLVAVVALFAISEIMFSLEESSERIFKKKIGKLLPTLKDWGFAFWAMIRGTVIGFLIGIPPGGGPTIGSFIAYGVEQRMSKRPEKFGHGAIEGIAACEAANNSAAVGQMIPLFSLGIPGSPSMAVLFGALIILGLDPGPFLFQQHSDFAWSVIASMYIGNVMLLAMNLPLIGIFVKLLNVPYKVLMSIIMVFAFVGVYSVNNSVFDIGLMIAIGVIGYILRKLDFSPVPAILCLVLGDKIEMAFRRSLIMSNGNPVIFLTRPLSAGILLLALLFAVLLVISIRKNKIVAETSG